VIGLIGSGGMGAVYLTDDNRLEGRRCAVKETRLLGQLSESASAALRAQFHREANTLARLDHPNLPKVSDYFSEANRDYLVMDYIPGPDFSKIIAEAQRDSRFLPVREVLGWTGQLCEALSYLHSQQPPVVHRDVKPANIKLTAAARVKLVDFGLVKPLDPEDPTTLTSLHGVGSLPYTPLEQYIEQIGHTDPRSDLYALAATLYHLLTGELPPSAQARFLDSQALIPPGRINPAVTPGLEAAILGAMALHPHDRPASVAIWQSSLTGLHSLPAASPDGPLAQGAPAAAAGRLLSRLWNDNRLLAGLAILLLAAAVLVTFG
jgi:serine/threonine-protein kinase